MKRTMRIMMALLPLLGGTASAWGQVYDLPFKGQDLRDDERVYWHRKIHSEDGPHGPSVQKFGYDLDVRRYDASSKRWTFASGSAAVNKNWFVYDRPVYAMRTGKVIACWRNAPENSFDASGKGVLHEELTRYPGKGSRIYGGGNGFWIEHADGTRAEYAHFRPGTADPDLCPHHDALMPQVIASPNVIHAWRFIRVEPAKQKTVRAGQLLGRVGNAGTGSNPHLHVHVERGGTVSATEMKGGTPVNTEFRRGLATSFSDAKGPYVKWTSFAGKPIPPGPTLVWPPRTVVAEHTRFGLDASRFGAIFQHLTDSGFQPAWIDGYSVANRSFINTVWRPANGTWRAFFLLSESRYQQEFDNATGAGFAPVFVDSSLRNGQPRYSVVFVKNKPGKFLAHHRLTQTQHEATMNRARNLGLAPVNVSVASIGGQLRYTVLYRSGNIGDWRIRSRMLEGDFQAEYNTQRNQGRRPVYLNAYMHGGKPFLTAVFGKIQTPARKDRHLMSGAKLQQEFNSALKSGLLTRSIAAFDGAKSNHRFAASWWK